MSRCCTCPLKGYDVDCPVHSRNDIQRRGKRPDAAPREAVKCDRCHRKMSLAEPWARRVYHVGCAEVVELAAHTEDDKKT